MLAGLTLRAIWKFTCIISIIEHVHTAYKYEAHDTSLLVQLNLCPLGVRLGLPFPYHKAE